MTKLDLHLGDCLEVMKSLPAESVDLVVTSPPYNIGIAYNSYQDKRPWEEYVSWCLDWATEIRRVLKEEGSFFLNVGNAPKTPYFSQKLMLQLVEGVDGKEGLSISTGHFKPINSKRFLNDCHEDLYHLTKTAMVSLDRKGAGVPYADKSNINRWGHTGGEDKRCRGNNWFIPYETINVRETDRPHPASFPPALVQQCIKLHGKGRESVLLEPFMGIGSAGVGACREKISRFIGVEMDAEYFRLAEERIEPENFSGNSVNIQEIRD